MITKTQIKCANCGKEVEKLASEIKRQKKKGKKLFYCDLSCAGKMNSGHLQSYIKQNSQIIQKYCDNRKDEYSPFRYHLNGAKKRNKQHKKGFNIDLEYLKELWNHQQGKCAVTGLELRVKYIHTKKQKTDKSPYQASLDRIDNNKGYIKGNVRFVCLMFNIARNDFSDNEVLEFFQKIASNIK